jgi:hypothetical protein
MDYLERVALQGATVDSVGLPATGTLTLTGVIVPGSHAESVLTSDATNVADAETVTIGTTVYRYKDTMALAYDVKRGADAATSLDNLKAAINASGTPGTEYFAGTLAHPTVVATTNTDTTQKIVARVPGTAANAAATTETSAHLSWADTTLGGGTGASNPGVTTAAATVTIGSRTYTFVDVLSETNAPAAAIANQVLFGADSAAALDNLKLAINAGATVGTNYSTGTAVHADVEATTNTNTAQTVSTLVKSTAGNSIATTETLTNGEWGASTLTGGVDSTEFRDNVNVEGYSKIGIQLVAADIASGNGVFTVQGTIDGTHYKALSVLIDNAANTNYQTQLRVASKTLSANGSEIVWLVDTPVKAIRVLVDTTTDGTYSAYVIATS